MDRRPWAQAVFADFQFDFLRLVLRKSGRRIRLETKPAQILELLLQNPGELVTREQLRSSIWPDGVHLDFEHALNKCTHKLRSALSDNHAEPQFIETIPRRGYRFIAPVEFVPHSSEDSRDTLQFAPNAQIPEATAGVPSSPVALDAENVSGAVILKKKSPLIPLNRRSLMLAAAAIAVVAALVTTAFWRAHGAKPIRPSITVLGFRNLSGDARDAWLSTAFSEWLSVDLGSAERLRLVSPQDSARAASELRVLDDAYLSTDTLAKLRDRLGADLAVSGAYAVSGALRDQVRLDVVLRRTSTGETIRSFSLRGDRSRIFALAGEAGGELREALHLPAVSAAASGIARTSLPSDPDAARFYAQGLQHLRAFDAGAALELFLKAEKLEPTHAMIHLALASAYSTLGRSYAARDEAKKALDLSANLPREQFLVIRGQYHEAIGDSDSAAEDYAALFRFFPDQVGYGLRLASAQIGASRPAEALKTLNALRQLPAPVREDPRIDLEEAEAAAALSDFPHQRDAAVRASLKGARNGSSLLVAHAQVAEGEALRSLGQLRAAFELWQTAQKTFRDAGDLSGVAQTLNRQAFVLWKLDKISDAEALYQQSIGISRSLQNQATLAGALADLGNMLIYENQPRTARQNLRKALVIYHSVGNTREEAYTLSLLGDLQMTQRDLSGANELYQQSLLLSRQAGDKSRIAGRLMDLGIVETWQGLLPMADANLSSSVRLFRELGQKLRVAHALNRLALVRAYQGRLPEAKQFLDESIALAAAVGDKTTVNEPRIDLAWVLLELGQPDQSERVARQSIDERSHNSSGLSWVRLAYAQCAQSKFAECKNSYSSAEQAVPRPVGLGDFEIDLHLVHAQLLASEHNPGAARDELIKARNLAYQAALVSDQLKVRLALGQFYLRHREFAKGRSELASLKRDAKQKGFGLFAEQADSALGLTTQARTITAKAQP